MTQILSVRKRLQNPDRNPDLLLGRVKPYLGLAIDASLNSFSTANRTEVVLLLRREDAFFHVRYAQEESLKVAWEEPTTGRLRRDSRIVDDWESIKQQEVERAIAICKSTVIEKMMGILQMNKYTISVEAVLKFKDGRFNWITYKEEMSLA